ncbi:hypothetical protein [Neobacillus terrae]|uniref:hypothetical protein n=1 Tax=Neobacillus terrae TaxID=3034837 RepID=UPI00140E80F3|nr:hypothetical protein [Neobacillus terrae]NHM33638.1 hypothetical protein [Neobacillus terrae]
MRYVYGYLFFFYNTSSFHSFLYCPENESIKTAEIAKAKKEADLKAAAAAKAKKEAERKTAAAAKANDPMTWTPGVKEKFEKEFYEAGYADTKDSITYKNAYVNDGQGFYEVWAQGMGNSDMLL